MWRNTLDKLYAAAAGAAGVIVPLLFDFLSIVPDVSVLFLFAAAVVVVEVCSAAVTVVVELDEVEEVDELMLLLLLLSCLLLAAVRGEGDAGGGGGTSSSRSASWPLSCCMMMGKRWNLTDEWKLGAERNRLLPLEDFYIFIIKCNISTSFNCIFVLSSTHLLLLLLFEEKFRVVLKNGQEARMLANSGSVGVSGGGGGGGCGGDTVCFLLVA